jgi:hypothetical protein
MRVDHLSNRVADYMTSIETVVEKKTYWEEKTKPLLLDTLHEIVKTFNLGWKVQELDWIHNDDAINVTFDSFPAELVDCTNKIPAFQFIPGATLVFSQSYNGQVFVFVLYPQIETEQVDTDIVKLGAFTPQEITRKLIIEKVDAFLKEMINWEVPSLKRKLGY